MVVLVSCVDIDSLLSVVTESREAAYLYAIMSAMGMYTVTRNCAKSKIVNCNCGDKPREPSPGFDWGRCTEDVNFGYAKTKEFIDAAETPNSRGVYSAAGQMNIQNNEAGRLVSISSCLHARDNQLIITWNWCCVHKIAMKTTLDHSKPSGYALVCRNICSEMFEMFSSTQFTYPDQKLGT